MGRNETRCAAARFDARSGYTTLLLSLLTLLAACGSVSSNAKATATPAAPTATPIPKGRNAVISSPVGSEGNLTDIAALSASDAWAVGQYEGADSLQRTLIKQWIGSKLSQVPSPNPSQRFNFLSAVSALSAHDVRAVSSGHAASNKNERLIEHWDGKTWAITRNPVVSQGEPAPSGVAALAASDAWAIGSGLSNGQRGCGLANSILVEH
jgi:hypothetical protein